MLGLVFYILRHINNRMITKIHKTNEEWKKILTPEQYKVMREHGTEAPFSCQWENPPAGGGEGIYHCAACDLPLFRAGQNSNREPAGRVTTSRLHPAILNILRIILMVCAALKSAAHAANLIWGMCFPTGRLQREKDTA